MLLMADARQNGTGAQNELDCFMKLTIFIKTDLEEHTYTPLFIIN